MKTVILMRHSKAETMSLLGDDYERALSQKGVKRTALIGDYFQKHGMTPDAILTSASKRTTETVERLLPHFASEPPAMRSSW